MDVLINIPSWLYTVNRYHFLSLVNLIEDAPAPYLISVVTWVAFEPFDIGVTPGVCLQVSKASVQAWSLGGSFA
jgi:hypothetical protein